MIKTFPFRLDIEKEYNNRMYSVNSNDLQTVKFTFVITDNGIPLNLTGLTVRIAIRKPDKKAVWQDCTVTNAPKGEVEVILTNQAYIKKGEYEAELMLYKGTDTVAITQKFHYRAAEGIMNDKSLQSQTVLGPIDQKLAEVEETLNDIRKNGTGIDAQARQDIEEVTTQLADKASKQEIQQVATTLIEKANKAEMDMKTSNIQAQVNSLVLEATGDSNPEVIQSRPDNKGSYFLVSKERLDNIENVIDNNLSIFRLGNFEVATINTDGTEGAHNKRVRSGFSSISFIPESFTLKVTQGFRIGLFWYDGSNTFISRTWYETDTLIEKVSNQLRIVIAAIDDRVATIDAFKDKYSIQYKRMPHVVIPTDNLYHKPGKNKCDQIPIDYIMGGDTTTGYKFYKSGSNPKTYIISCEPSKTYTIKVPKPSTPSDRFRIFLTSVKKGDLKIETYYKPPNCRLLVQDDKLSEYTFTTGENDYSIIFYSTLNGATPQWVMCQEGDEFTGYEPYKESKFLQTKQNEINTDAIDFEFHYLRSMATPIYYPYSPYLSPIKSNNRSIDNYALWDGLMAKYPHNITKRKLANEATGLPINLYEFKPVFMTGDYQYNPLKKVIYFGAVHGHEIQAQIEDYKFFKELYENEKNDPILNYIKQNTHFIVVPQVSPWGVNNDSRVNSRRVNINRNFPSYWEKVPDDDGLNYSGEAGQIEIETQCCLDIMQQHKDAILVFDHHNWWDLTNEGAVAGAISNTKTDQHISIKALMELDSFLKLKHSWITTENQENLGKTLYKVTKTNTPGTLKNEAYTQGRSAILYESSINAGSSYSNNYDEDVQNMSVAGIAALIKEYLVNAKY